jgi:putative ABC transport system permease protein
MALMALRLALSALARNKLRAFLTVLGILIGVASVVAMTALGAGAQERMAAQMASLGVNMLVVMPASLSTGGAHTGLGTASGLTDADAEAIVREVPTIAATAPALSSSAQAVYGNRNWGTHVTGTTSDYFRVRSWAAQRGAVFDAIEESTGARVCVIGETVRANLFPRENPIGRMIRLGHMPCRVIGVLAAKGQSGFGQDQDDIVIVPLATYRQRIARLPGGQVSVMYLSARYQSVSHHAQSAVTALLRQRHRIQPGAENNFAVRNLEDLANSYNEQQSALTLLLLAVASISLLVGGIGVMNIMLVSVTERTREIGIRMAIGAQAKAILSQFLVEAIVLSGIGGVLGLVVGIIATVVMGRLTHWSVSLQPMSAVAAVAVASGIGVVFGFFPARSAAALDPIIALRHE